ncbi:hypothetical protein D3C86_1352830 [compost metagenome]
MKANTRADLRAVFVMIIISGTRGHVELLRKLPVGLTISKIIGHVFLSTVIGIIQQFISSSNSSGQRQRAEKPTTSLYFYTMQVLFKPTSGHYNTTIQVRYILPCFITRQVILGP